MDFHGESSVALPRAQIGLRAGFICAVAALLEEAVEGPPQSLRLRYRVLNDML